MKLLICLFLAVVCVHCIPIYEDDIGRHSEKLKPFVKDYNGLDLNFASRKDHKDGSLLLKKTNDFVLEVVGCNVSVNAAKPPPFNSGSVNCSENCTLIQPNNPWIQNSLWAIPNSPLPMPYNSWEMPYNPWAMQNNPWANPYSLPSTPNNPRAIQNSSWVKSYSPFAMPNNPWAMQNSPWTMPNNPLGEPYNQWGIPNNQSII